MTVDFLRYPKVNDDNSDATLYGDIIRHCKDWQHYADLSKYTSAHECTHGINNDLRLASGDWDKKNGFYVGKDLAIILDEPKIKKSQIADFIPQELRSARYSLYVAGQQSWDDKPLYIYDEGVAYVNGAWAAIELKEQENYVENARDHIQPWYGGLEKKIQMLGKSYCYPTPITYWKSSSTIVDGEIEFIAYMAAVLLAANKLAPPLDQKLIDFSRWLFSHASNAYYRSKKDNFLAFDVQDKLWDTMKTGSCYSEQRSFLKNKIGYVFPDGEVPEDNGPTPPPWFV